LYESSTDEGSVEEDGGTIVYDEVFSKNATK